MAKVPKYYLLLCETLTGAEAERIGVISLLASDGELDAKAVEIAEKLAGGARDQTHPGRCDEAAALKDNWLAASAGHLGPSTPRWRSSSWALQGRRRARAWRLIGQSEAPWRQQFPQKR